MRAGDLTIQQIQKLLDFVEEAALHSVQSSEAEKLLEEIRYAMNCTNCGKFTEGDAHVFGEQILCDTCADAYMEYLEGRG